MKSIRTLIGALCVILSLSASAMSDAELLTAYLHQDMSVWKTYIDNLSSTTISDQTLLYEYGYCGYIVDRDKQAAKPYVKRFRQHVEALRGQLPKGHYEMYMSAVYVYELRTKESIHPVTAMNLAKKATRLASQDPLVLSYYGTCLFYAPKPFGSKREALEWFEKAKALFGGSEWRYCWVREATEMYIRQCHEKLKKQ